MFEIIVESLKFELEKILKANESYKTDYYTCNRKKFLLTNFYNANSEFEQSAYMNEIVSQTYIFVRNLLVTKRFLILWF
jgi:hypothetical protein